MDNDKKTTIDLSTPVENILGIGKEYARRLAKLEINTVKDLLYHAPSRYLDRSIIAQIGSLQEGENITVKAKVEDIKLVRIFRKRMTLQKSVVSDETGKLDIVWFNQPYLVNQLKNKTVFFSGEVKKQGKKLQLISPEYEIDTGSPTIHTGTIVPIYPETYGISSKWLRNKIKEVRSKITAIPDALQDILKNDTLLTLENALRHLHQPQEKSNIEKARTRLAFDELFESQMVGLIRKNQWRQKKAPYTIETNKYTTHILNLYKILPFSLTRAQKKVIKEILEDLSQDKPMNRLLQGDVGSGKTVVAAVAIYTSHLAGYHSLFMCPTEILALQHYNSLKKLLSPQGIKVSLNIGSKKLIEDKGTITVGTHALLFDNIYPKQNIGLVVIDEQHRFGVEQRGKLLEGNKVPHVLTMTATPIPRTIALTLYGELDLSVIDELPPGRKPVKTYVVPSNKHDKGYAWIREKIIRSKSASFQEQAYIVYPLIDESDILTEVKSLVRQHEKLSKGIFTSLKVGLLHGKMKPSEKEEILENYHSGKIDILMSTSVVEVGVDIPHATIIAIEEADRFGLAQLHQLRGRVGRNDQESFCFLFTAKPSSRLYAMTKYNEGMKLAELDLKYRGSGETYGIRQHGRSTLKFADFTQVDLIDKARRYAQNLLKQDPNLKSHPLILNLIKSKLNLKIKPN